MPLKNCKNKSEPATRKCMGENYKELSKGGKRSKAQVVAIMLATAGKAKKPNPLDKYRGK